MSNTDESLETVETVEGSGPSSPSATKTVGLSESAARRVGADSLLPAGAKVGRYLIVDHVGSGGMGAVYRAFDPDLNRQVALKILRMRAVPSADESTDRARLLREAQALAQVSHPNVIAVHDVGVIDGQVFIAMELVAGKSLRAWLRDEQRPRDEILRMFLQAGDGLAAAHASGLVHRDFKPDNAIVGDDGRVRVIDFGLARATELEGVPPAPSAKELLASTTTDSGMSTHSGMLSESMTRTGAVMGTPRYMAPEQFLQETTDAKADQFAFCVALYEAVCKTRPFRGKHFDELRSNVLKGRVQPPKAEANAPAALVKTITQGLSALPEERHPSMQALLAELRRDRWLWWRRGGIAAALVALIGITSTLAVRSGQQPDRCADSATNLVGVWDAPTRRAVERGFSESPLPRAGTTWERVAPVLDDFATDWVNVHETSCRATLIRGDQSELLFERRSRCLRRHLQQVDGFVDLLKTELDSALVDKAATAARELTTLRECTDDEGLLAEVPLPEDAASRARVEKASAEVDRARMLETSGRYRESYDLLERVEKQTRDVEYPPLRARALFKLAMLTEKGGDAATAETLYFQAVAIAADAKDEFLAAQIWNEILWVVGHRLGRYEEALKLEPATSFAVTLADRDPRVAAQFASYKGVLYYGVGKYKDSLESFEKAVTGWETLGDAHVRQLANELNNLANALVVNDREDDAIATYERSYKLLEKALGEGHPLTKHPMFNLADARARRGQFDEALALHQKVLEMNKSLLGDTHPDVAHSYHSIGAIYLNTEKVETAIEWLSKAIAMWDQVLSPEDARRALTLELLGRAHSRAGRYDEADRHLERAVALTEKAFGDSHPYLVSMHDALGQNEFRRKRYERARAHFDDARRVAAATHPEGHYSIATVDMRRAHCDVRLGRSAAAAELAQSARDALAQTAQEAPTLANETALGWANFVLAEALWAGGNERERALDLGRMAASALDRPGSRTRQAEVTAWLDARAAAAGPTAANP